MTAKSLRICRPDELLSTDLLQNNGIREPLYVTALRYAGVEVTAAKHPGHLPDLKLEKATGGACATGFRVRRKAGQAARRTAVADRERRFLWLHERQRKNLEHISFSVTGAKCWAIVGQNGAGKSTLSKLICGLKRRTAAAISLNGRDLNDRKYRERAEHIGYVMQNPNQMISKVMIYDEVALGLSRSCERGCDPRAGGRDAEDLWPVSVPKLADLRTFFWTEEACDHRQCSGESGIDHSSMSRRRGRISSLYRNYGVFAKIQ